MILAKLRRDGGALIFFVGWALIFSVAEAGEIRYDKESRRDPFQPLIGPYAFRALGEGDKEILPIEGIVFDPKEGSYVVVGGEIYREGETIQGAQIIKVLPDRVILLQESEEVVIWLREEIVETEDQDTTEGKEERE